MGNDLDLTQSKFACGSSVYYFKNRTLHFRVTGSDCVVYVEMRDNIKITFTLQVTQSEFYSNGRATDFSQHIATFLDIDMSRVRIAGFSTGRRQLADTDNDLIVEVISDKSIGGTA